MEPIFRSKWVEHKSVLSHSQEFDSLLTWKVRAKIDGMKIHKTIESLKYRGDHPIIRIFDK